MQSKAMASPDRYIFPNFLVIFLKFAPLKSLKNYPISPGKHFRLYLALAALAWAWYRSAKWWKVEEGKWTKKAIEGDYPLEPLREGADFL